MPVQIIERDVTQAELALMNAGFDEHGREHGVMPHAQTRYGFAVIDGEKFVGLVSGLTDNNWFYLTDLWLEKEYRKNGLGAALLKKN